MANVFGPVIVTIISHVVAEPSPAFAPVRLSILPAGIVDGATSVCIGTGGSAAKWIMVVRVAGIDISARLLGNGLVDASEGAARIADVTFKPMPGTMIDLPTLCGAPLTIDIADMTTGVPRYSARVFTGYVDNPEYDPIAKTVSLRCTDDLQGRVDAMSSADIDALPGSYYSPVVFDASAVGWVRLNDRLSTIPACFDMSAEGAFRLTPWEPNPTPDLSFDASIASPNGLSIAVADRASLVNWINVDFSYRFPRVKAEGYRVGYTAVDMTGFATFISEGRSFMQRAQVEAALHKAGAHIESIAYTDLPTTPIAVGAGYWTPGPFDSSLCMAWTALVSFDYAQTIEERHAIVVKNARSITAVGYRKEKMSGALVGVYPDLTASETSIQRYKEKSSSIPPSDLAPVAEDKTTSADVTLTPESDRAAANSAMQTLIAIAKTRIWESHRRNRVTFAVPLNPAIDVSKTISLNLSDVNAVGKCARVVHRFSTDSAEAVSEVTIALCAVAGVGITHPDDAPVAPSGTAPGETTLAYTPNVTFPNLPVEDKVLTVTFPGIETIERNKSIANLSATYAAGLIEDVFTVTV